MERRARTDSQYSCSYLFTLGLLVGAGLGMVTTYLQINPFQSLLPSGTDMSLDEEQTLEIQQALQLVANNQVGPESTLPSQLLIKSEEVMARLLAQEVRILCMVMTNATNHKTKAAHVKQSWGRHCSKLVFMSDETDKSLPSVDTGSEWHRSGPWAKTIASFKYVWRNYRDSFDWIIKTDDTNFVFVEDLQEMLLPYTPDEPIFFGFRMNPVLPQGYMSDNAGVVMSKETVMRLVNFAFDGKDARCPQWSEQKNPDDVNLGQCLAVVNAEAGDSRDWEGRHRFFPMDVETHAFVEPTKYKWFWTYTFWPAFIGMEGCADKPVSFHYIKPKIMYMIEYLAFYVRPFIVNHLEINTPTPTAAKAPTTLSPTIAVIVKKP